MIYIYALNYFNHSFCMQSQERECNVSRKIPEADIATQKTKTHNLRIAGFNHNFIISTERKHQYLKNYAANFKIAQHLFQSIYT